MSEPMTDERLAEIRSAQSIRRLQPCTHPEYVVFLEAEELLAEIDRLRGLLESRETDGQ